LFRGSYLSFDHSPNPFYDVNDISTPLFNGGKLNQGSSTLLDDGVVLNQRDRIRYQLDSDLVGSFYLNSLSYQDLNYLLNIKGLETLSNVLHDQTLLVGSLRWSYRYNTLHRRSIYNSHKLTESKKLISAGFFDSSSMDNNLWFSDQFARIMNMQKKGKSLNTTTLLKYNWNLLYKSNLKSPYIKPFFTSVNENPISNNFIKLNLYETSFHFFLKRTKLFNSMQSNVISQSPNLQISNVDDQNHDLGVSKIYNYSISEFTKSLSDNLTWGQHNVNHDNLPLDNTNPYSNSYEDILLLHRDKEIFSMQTLVSWHNIVNSNTLLGSTVQSNSYLQYHDQSTNTPSISSKIFL
jgi:hypothetical protein